MLLQRQFFYCAALHEVRDELKRLTGIVNGWRGAMIRAGRSGALSQAIVEEPPAVGSSTAGKELGKWWNSLTGGLKC